MLLYIHVPFCRHKCHYCGFYSEALGLKCQTPESHALMGSGTPLISSSVFEQKKEEENPYLAQIDNFFKASAEMSNENFAQKLADKKEADELASFLKQNTEPYNPVQSLADVLKAKKSDTKPNSPSGPTLADAFLSPKQAGHARQSLGIKEVPRVQEQHSTAPAKTSDKDTYEQIKRLSQFLGGTLDYTDQLAQHQETRLSFASAGMHKKQSNHKTSKALPKKFHESHNADEHKLYQVWLKSLLAEIKILSEIYKNIPITSIFFGGGTPSLIPVQDMDLILRTLFKHFSVQASAEISMEANPESINKNKAMAYSAMGFNRISLGVQSLQDSNLKLLGRVHSAKQAITAFKTLRQAKFHNINLDFMWALPDQKNIFWKQDMRAALDLDPEHMSCYGLSIEEDSYFEKLEAEGKLNLPLEQEQALMYRTTCDMLRTGGFLQYEISNFSKVGYQCKHNLAYWEGEDYLGLGPSATSTVNIVRRNHAQDIIEWAKDIQNPNFPQFVKVPSPTQGSHYFQTEILSHKEILQEFIMLRLRTTKGINLNEYQELFGHSFVKKNLQLIQALSKHQLVKVSKDYIALSPNGMLVSNSIIERFF